MDFWRSAGGTVRLQITGASPELLLTKLNQNGITIFNLQHQDEITSIFTVRRKDYTYITQQCSVMGINICTQGQQGLYWAGKRFLRRPILMIAYFFLMGLIFLLPTRVLFFRVEGNDTVPDRRILEAAENCGIRFGASRRDVRSEKVKNALIGAVSELQWAGVNTKGCVATISVRERTNIPQNTSKRLLSSVVANQDGFIISATATRGNLLVQPGQSVTAGQTLISGINELGILIHTTGAEGEIFAQTHRQLTVISPLHWYSQNKTGRETKKYSLLIGKKRINLWKDSGISDATCGRMYKEMYVTLPGNFVLPVALCMETYEEYKWEKKISEEMVENAGMQVFAENYLIQQMIAGQIMKSKQQWLCDEDVFLLKANYVCQEMIGRHRQEQIGDIHE